MKCRDHNSSNIIFFARLIEAIASLVLLQVIASPAHALTETWSFDDLTGWDNYYSDGRDSFIIDSGMLRTASLEAVTKGIIRQKTYDASQGAVLEFDFIISDSGVTDAQCQRSGLNVGFKPNSSSAGDTLVAWHLELACPSEGNPSTFSFSFFSLGSGHMIGATGFSNALGYEVIPELSSTVGSYLDALHTAKIVVRPDQLLEFYVDGNLLWRSEETLDSSLLDGQIVIQDHISGFDDSGKQKKSVVKIDEFRFTSLTQGPANCISSVTDDVHAQIDDWYYSTNEYCYAFVSITAAGQTGKNVKVMPNARVIYNAPSISLQPGFSVASTGIFRAGAVTATQPLNDTGITPCTSENSLGSCPISGYPGQDAEHGRDATHSDDSDGRAGFSFTKLDASGNPLPADATEWSCTRDNVTALVWEVKNDGGGLHHREDTFSWYNTDNANNGGVSGYADSGGNTCHGYNSADPASYCNTQAFVARVNQKGWCGYHDWRLPTREELRSLINYNHYYWGTAMDPLFSWGGWTWSSSTYARLSSDVWVFWLSYGLSDLHDKGNNNSVVLVRGAQ